MLAKLGNEFALAFSVAFLFWREKKWGIFSAHHRTKNMDQFIPGKINSLSASRWFFLQSDATATLQRRTTHESNRGSRTRENLINYEESNKYAFGIREAAYYGVLEMLCGDQRGLSAQQPENLVQRNKIFLWADKGTLDLRLGILEMVCSCRIVQCTWVKILAPLSCCTLQVTALVGVAKDS